MCMRYAVWWRQAYSAPVSSCLQICQLALERTHLVLLLSECSAKPLHFACPAVEPAVLTVTGGGLIPPLRPLVTCCTGLGLQLAGCNTLGRRGSVGALDQLPLVACMQDASMVLALSVHTSAAT